VEKVGRVAGALGEADEQGSCQRGIAGADVGLERAARQEERVDMMSKFQPCLRAIPSAFGTLGVSM